MKVHDIYQQQPRKRCLMWLCMYLPHVCIDLLFFQKRGQFWLFSLELTPAVPQCLLFTAKTGWRAVLAPLTAPRVLLGGQALRTKFLVAKCQRTHWVKVQLPIPWQYKWLITQPSEFIMEVEYWLGPLRWEFIYPAGLLCPPWTSGPSSHECFYAIFVNLLAFHSPSLIWRVCNEMNIPAHASGNGSLFFFSRIPYKSFPPLLSMRNT